MLRIPIVSDVAELIGPVAEKVENRSLLLDKFPFHKSWPKTNDSDGKPIKWDDASRWSFTRIANGAPQILLQEASKKRSRSKGSNAEIKNQERLLAEAQIAEALSKVSWDDKELSDLRARHTRRFLGLFRNALSDRSAVIVGQLESRLAINLADSLIQNAGISLDRLFGFPFIPGSAVKGVCRYAALHELKSNRGKDEEQVIFTLFREVFGTSDNDYSSELRQFHHLLGGRPQNNRGRVAFLPAYPINDARVVVDLTNVHYPDYYRSGDTRDLSKERPRPNPFPAVEKGAQFAFCLALTSYCGDTALLQAAKRWLEAGLTVHGIGAKTASGYGWFSLQPKVAEDIQDAETRHVEATAAKAKAELEAQAKLVAEQERQAALSPEDRATESLLKLSDEAFANTAKELTAKPEFEQRALIRLLGKEKKDRWKTWKKKKPELAAAIEAVRQKLNAPPLP